MRYYEALRIAVKYAKRQRSFEQGQLGYVMAAWSRIYTSLYQADPALVDSKDEIKGIIDGILASPLPEY